MCFGVFGMLVRSKLSRVLLGLYLVTCVGCGPAALARGAADVTIGGPASDETSVVFDVVIKNTSLQTVCAFIPGIGEIRGEIYTANERERVVEDIPDESGLAPRKNEPDISRYIKRIGPGESVKALISINKVMRYIINDNGLTRNLRNGEKLVSRAAVQIGQCPHGDKVFPSMIDSWGPYYSKFSHPFTVER